MSAVPGTRVRQLNLSMRMRFYAAMASYALLALAATFTLEGKFRLVVWIVLAAFALRTYLVKLQQT